MKHKIEIHDNNTNETGTYSIWFKDDEKVLHRVILSENETDSLLNMRQKESFFMGKWKFQILTSDFNTLVRKFIESKNVKTVS